jgi:glycerol uptake facilitator-like aquaporin
VFAPLAIGLFIFTQASVIGPISGGSLNPAISLAPAIVAADLSDVWIYIIGPLAGGVLGGLVHAYFRDDIADRAAPWRHQDAGPVATD